VKLEGTRLFQLGYEATTDSGNKHHAGILEKSLGLVLMHIMFLAILTIPAWKTCFQNPMLNFWLK
jgi:hypothetical protein